jgi:hypothetical protein
LRLVLFLLTIAQTGCVDDLTQVAGTGATYTTKCSAEMTIKNGNQYFTNCQPEACSGNFRSGPVSHVVVGIEPGKRLVGYAERICIQDLAESSGLFNPGLFPPEEPATTEEKAADKNGDID